MKYRVFSISNTEMANAEESNMETNYPDTFINGNIKLLSVDTERDLVIARNSKVIIESNLCVKGTLHLLYGACLVVNKDITVLNSLITDDNCQIDIKGKASLSSVSLGYNCKFDAQETISISTFCHIGHSSYLGTHGDAKLGSLNTESQSCIGIGGKLVCNNSFLAGHGSIINVTKGITTKELILGPESSITTNQGINALTMDIKARCNIKTQGGMVVKQCLIIASDSYVSTSWIISCSLWIGNHATINVSKVVYAKSCMTLKEGVSMSINECMYSDKVIINDSCMVKVNGIVRLKTMSINYSLVMIKGDLCVLDFLKVSHVSKLEVTNSVYVQGKVEINNNSVVKISKNLYTQVLVTLSDSELDIRESILVSEINEVMYRDTLNKAIKAIKGIMNSESLEIDPRLNPGTISWHGPPTLFMNNNARLKVNEACINATLRMGYGSTLSVEGSLETKQSLVLQAFSGLTRKMSVINGEPLDSNIKIKVKDTFKIVTNDESDDFILDGKIEAKLDYDKSNVRLTNAIETMRNLSL